MQIREFMGILGNASHQFLLAGRIYFLWFVLYSFVGWCYESAICSQVKYHRFLNRGFLKGPWIPIYGAGAVLNYWLIGWIGNVPGIFLAAMFTSGVVEYLTSYAMERMFHKRWWDYTRYRYNLNGRICLYGCVIFGVANVVMLRFIHPGVMQMTGRIPEHMLTGMVLCLYLLFMTDVIYTIIHMETIQARIDCFSRQLRDRRVCRRLMVEEQMEYYRICVEEKKDYCLGYMTEKREYCRDYMTEKREYCRDYMTEKRAYCRDYMTEKKEHCLGYMREKLGLR